MTGASGALGLGLDTYSHDGLRTPIFTEEVTMSLTMQGLFQMKRRKERGKTPDSGLFLDISWFSPRLWVT